MKVAVRKLLLLAGVLISISVAAEENCKFDWNVTPRLTKEHPKALNLTLSDSVFDEPSPVSPDAYRVPVYKPLDDISWVGIPIFISGIIAKGEKKAFRQDYNNTHANTRLVTHFKTSIDDYTQYFGPALTLGLKIGGVEGRSQWGRMLASMGMTYGIMAALVNGIKYTSKELRPDGTSYNSWPSGHTATSFAGATILHKEYGLTRSPWYSVGGYAVATATGVMRVLNNRHWVSDILSGAGIGIMSGELAYMLSDLIFKDKYLLRGELQRYPDLRKNPSFFSISMGIGFGSPELDFSGVKSQERDVTMGDFKLKFQMSTVVGAEGAYFFNKFVGAGGRLRVRTTPVKGWSNVLDYAEKDIKERLEGMTELAQKKDPDFSLQFNGDVNSMVTDKELSIESDHLTEFAIDGGLYFNIPISKRFAIGTKVLIGSSLTQALDLNAHLKGTQWNMDYSYNVVDGKIDWDSFSFDAMSQAHNEAGEVIPYEAEWDFFTLTANRSTKFGTGISLTYAHKHNFCWRVFLDYDNTYKTYTLTKDSEHFMTGLFPNAVESGGLFADLLVPEVYQLKKNMHQFVLGGSFCISF